jgi:hypothetical protein
VIFVPRVVDASEFWLKSDNSNEYLTRRLTHLSERVFGVTPLIFFGAMNVWKKSYTWESDTPFVFNTFVPESLTVFKIMKQNV